MREIAYIVLTFKFKEEEGIWIARCEELGTSTFADTLKEAQEDLKDAVLLHLNTLEQVGECERFFEENNIKVYTQRPKKRELKISGPFDINTLATPYIYPIHKELLGI